MSAEKAAAGVLALSAVAGLLVYNNGGAAALDTVAQFPLTIDAIGIHLDVHGFVGEFLLGLFFLIAGIELRHELGNGHLAGRSAIVLPTLAAIGGSIVPAIIFVLITANNPEVARGWAIPMATDITFAIAVFAVGGSRLPRSGRTFLLSFAIIDDIIAIVVIALFLGGNFDALWAVGSAAALTVLGVLAPRIPWLVLPLALLAWYSAYQAGIQPAVMGAIIGLLLPPALGKTVERRISPWVMFGVLPVFALLALAIPLGGGIAWGSALTLAILLRPLGKVVGICGGVVLARRLAPASGFTDLSLGDFARIALLGGIGFTVALFVSTAVYGSGSPLGVEANIATLIAAIISALAGMVALRARKRISV